MKYLQIVNLALVALGATFSVVLGVVCLLFGLNQDQSVSIHAQLPFLLGMAGAFLVLTAASALAWGAHHRGWFARWIIQPLPGLAVAGIIAMLLSLR